VIGFGQLHPTEGYRSENLEAQTFPANSFDLVVTQDVFEHVFAPDRAIQEIARTLRPGGAHIMTVPIVRGSEPSIRRARNVNGVPTFLLEPQYHGNPMSAEGALVTIEWGYDIIDYLAGHSGLSISMFHFDDLSRGMRSVCQEVLVCKKTITPAML
jgi:SAM-dependent methyltransferase